MKAAEQKAILEEILQHEDLQKLRKFVADKGDLSLRIGFGSILRGAVISGKINLVKALLEAGADVNEEDVYKQIPLNNVTQLEIAQLLVENGADVFHLDKKKQDVVYYKICFGYYDITRYLNECRGDVFTDAELQALPPLADDIFWPIIEKEWRTSKNDETWQARHIMMRLRHENIPLIVGFEKKRALLSNVMHTSDFWAAATLIHGSSPSSGEFNDFKDWIIGFGKENMEKVIAKPDLLLKFVEKKKRYHNHSAYDIDTLSVALSEAYKYRTGLDNFATVVDYKHISEPAEFGFEHDWSEPELEGKKKILPKIWKQYKGN